MRLIAKNYGPQKRVDIELGDLVTLFVGPNNTGKTFVSRAIYALIKSCKGVGCNKDMLASILSNSVFASRKDLWLVSKDFSGRFELVLEGPKFKIDVIFDKELEEPLEVKVYGEVARINAIYAPSYRTLSTVLAPIANYGAEVSALLRKLLLVLTMQLAEEARTKVQQLEGSIPVQLEYYDDLYSFLRSFLSVFQFDPKVQRALTLFVSPLLLDLVIALYIIEKGEEIHPEVLGLFRDLFPEFPHRALGLAHVGEAVQEIPPQLLSSGIMQAMPILYAMNLASIYASRSQGKVLLLIDEPEINLELERQREFAEKLIKVVKKFRDEGIEISLVIATHSEFILYSITRWLARNGFRDLARVYEFTFNGVFEREIDERGEVEVETFSRAVRKMFFEDDLKE